MRFNSSGADSKDVENGGTCRNHSAGDDKMSSSRSGSRPPLGPSPSLGHSSHDLNQHGIGKAPPPGAPPTMYRASSTSPKALVDSRFKDRTNMNADQNFASDNWDDDDSPVKSKVMSSNSNGYAMNHSRSQSNSSMNSSPGCGPTMHTHLNPSADAGSKNLSRSSSFNSHAGVKEDSNWINEDFDD